MRIRVWVYFTERFLYIIVPDLWIRGARPLRELVHTARVHHNITVRNPFFWVHARSTVTGHRSDVWLCFLLLRKTDHIHGYHHHRHYYYYYCIGCKMRPNGKTKIQNSVIRGEHYFYFVSFYTSYNDYAFDYIVMIYVYVVRYVPLYHRRRYTCVRPSKRLTNITVNCITSLTMSFCRFSSRRSILFHTPV